MKSLISLYKSLGTAAFVLGLSGCTATPNAQEHKQHHPANAPAASTSSMPGGMMQGGMMGGQSGMMDMKAMCEMHSQMTNKSPEERQKMMESHGGNMSPEMMQQHMHMMNEKCR